MSEDTSREKIESRRPKMSKLACIPTVFFLLSSLTSFALAQNGSSNIESAFAHQKLARQHVEQKNWSSARDEAKLATSLAPDAEINRDAWLLLAATEERLGNLLEARDAYAKYLSLSPNPEKKQLVAERWAKIEDKANRYLSYKWGGRSSGLILGYSPVFQAETTTQIAGDLSNALSIGFRFAQMSFGYIKGVGKAGAFKAPATAKTNSTYTGFPAGARHVIEEIYFQYNIELTQDAERKAIVWSIPLYMAGVSNVVKLDTGKLYQTWGYDIATGLSVNLYTKSALSFDISALYHLGIPFGSMKNTDESLPIKTMAGDEVSGSTTGAEVRVGIKLSFGTTPPEED